MKKSASKYLPVIIIAASALIIAAALILGKNPSVVTIRCLEGTPIYDYASENGYDIYPYYSYNHIDFSVNEDEFKYETVDSSVMITAYTGNSEEVCIPETLGGNPVKTVAASTFEGKNISTLFVPESVVRMDCRFAASAYDPDLVAAVFFTALTALLAALFIRNLALNEKKGRIFGIPFAAVGTALAGCSAAVTAAAAALRQAAVPSLIIGTATVLLLTVLFIIARTKKA